MRQSSIVKNAIQKKKEQSFKWRGNADFFGKDGREL